MRGNFNFFKGKYLTNVWFSDGNQAKSTLKYTLGAFKKAKRK